MRWAVIGLVFLVGILSGWRGPAAQQREGSTPIRVSYPAGSLNYLPLFYGVEAGFYREEGMALQLLQVKSRVSISAVTAGSLEFTGSGTSVYSGVAQGLPLKVVAFLTVKPSFDLISLPAVTRIEDLKGKVVGVSALRSLSDIVTRKILLQHGLNPDKDVRIVATGDIANSLAALKGGSIQAGLLSPPFNVVAQQREGMRNLLFTGKIMDLSMSGLGTADRLIKERPSMMKGVLRGTVKSLIALQRDREAVTSYIARHWRVSPDMAAELFTFMGQVFSRDGSMGEATILAQAELETADLGVKALPLEKLVDFSFQRAAARELGAGSASPSRPR